MEKIRIAKEFYRKIVNRFKGSVIFKKQKKKTNFYWPEFHKYCGCCDLASGIYIRSVITLILTTILLVINGAILKYLLSISPIIYSANLTAIDEYILTSRDQPERDLETLQIIYKSLIVYYTIWISFKVIYVITVVWTAYAIYRKKPRMLKLLLYVSIPNWILDFFISFVGTSILANKFKILLVICNLSEGYNILAINSEYKRMRGKSRLAVDLETESRTEEIHVNNYINQREYQNSNQHCRGCSCLTENRRNLEDISTRTVEAINVGPTRPLNDNVAIRINVSNQTELSSSNDSRSSRRDSSVEGNAAASNVQTVGTNDGINLDIKIKVDVTDVPVIYDEGQLNVGSSPVIEDRQYLDTINDN